LALALWLMSVAQLPSWRRTSEPEHGGNGGGELEKRVTAVETRVTVIEKTMVTAEVFQRELAAFRDEMRLG
jgi:hypothetical protein